MKLEIFQELQRVQNLRLKLNRARLKFIECFLSGGAEEGSARETMVTNE